MNQSEWCEFPSAPCPAGKETWWQLASRLCWNRARPWHASELVSFLVRLALTVPPLSHLTSCTPTKSNLPLANSLATVMIRHSSPNTQVWIPCIRDSFYHWQGRPKQTQRPHHPTSAATGEFSVVWQIHFTSQTNVFGVICHFAITAAISYIIIAIKTLGKKVKFKLEQAMKAQWGEVLDVWLSLFNLERGG